MSYECWHDYGYGINFSEFDVECDKHGIPITPLDVERLLAKAPLLAQAVHEWLDDIKEDDPDHIIDIDDYREFDQDFSLELSKLFADTIQEAEGLPHVFATSDIECDHYVILGQSCPWHFNEREKSLTQEEMEAIFHKYLHILKPEAAGLFRTDVDSQSVENGG